MGLLMADTRHLTPDTRRGNVRAMKAAVHVPYVAWRNGRPRFAPGASLRALGFKGQDLKHEDGRWYSFEETQGWWLKQAAAIKAARKGAAPSPRSPAVRASAQLVTVGELVAEIFARPEFNGREVVDGKRRRRPRKASTVAWYRKLAVVVETDHADVWTSPARAITGAIAEAVIDKIEASRGLATARGCRALLSMTWGRLGRRHALGANPWRELELPVLEARLRPGTREEIAAMVAAADAIGLAEVGDMIWLGLNTGQRQNDRVALNVDQVKGGRLVLKQSKGDRPIAVRLLPQTLRRLDAARDRRKAQTVQWRELVIDERLNQPWTARNYNDAWRQVRDEAAKLVPSCMTLRDQDLRDTALTWLEDAGAPDNEKAAVSGHTEASFPRMKRHYVAPSNARADAAIDKLATWLKEKP